MVAREQPAKLAAFEGHFETGEGGTPMSLVGVARRRKPHSEGESRDPGGLSFLVYRDFRQTGAGA